MNTPSSASRLQSRQFRAAHLPNAVFGSSRGALSATATGNVRNADVRNACDSS